MKPITLEEIKDDKDPRIALMQMLASRDAATQKRGQELFANFSAPVIQQVLDQFRTSSLIYGPPKSYRLDYSNDPDIPIDPWIGIGENFINVWMGSSAAGGLATNHVTGPFETFRIRSHIIETAVSMYKVFATQNRLDQLERILNRVFQEILVKSEYNAWLPIMEALANGRVRGELNLLDSTLSGKFHPDDISRLKTKAARVRTSWVGGTPNITLSRGVTHAFISPELEEDLRSYSYNPINVAVFPEVGTESTAMPLTEDKRNQIFNTSGWKDIFGIQIVTLNELGIGQAWTRMFSSLYTAGLNDPVFDFSSQELVVALDLSLDGIFYHYRGQFPGDPSPLQALPDDQFRAREEKLGWYYKLREAYAVMDSKGVFGIIV